MKNKKAAMEMSVGTIVTIVLLMAVLILGIFLVQRIFKSSVNAIDEVDNEVQSQIRELFSKEGNKLAIYPTSRQITLEKGEDPSGFAFSVKNLDVETQTFTYSIGVDPEFNESTCGSTFSIEKGNSWLILPSGSTAPIGPGNTLDMPELVLFNIPEIAPPCTIPYILKINEGNYAGTKVYITIK